EDAARADLAEGLRAIAIASGRDRDQRNLNAGRAQAGSGDIRLREREPTAAAADADQHNAPAFGTSGRTSTHRGVAPEQTRSEPAAAAAFRSACRLSTLILAETEEVPHGLSINHAVGRHSRLFHADGRQVEELVDDLGRHRLDRSTLRLVETAEDALRLAELRLANLLGVRSK